MNPIIPRIAGYVTKVYVKDNDFVKKGDTLYSIARMFELTTEDLRKLNNLGDVNLSVGQVLNIAQP